MMNPDYHRRRFVYLAASQPTNANAARYVRLLTIGRFEIALAWVQS